MCGLNRFPELRLAANRPNERALQPSLATIGVEEGDEGLIGTDSGLVPFEEQLSEGGGGDQEECGELNGDSRRDIRRTHDVMDNDFVGLEVEVEVPDEITEPARGSTGGEESLDVYIDGKRKCDGEGGSGVADHGRSLQVAGKHEPKRGQDAKKSRYFQSKESGGAAGHRKKRLRTLR